MTDARHETRSLGVFAPSPLGVSILLGLLALVFLFRIFLSSWLNLLPDECSYWTWSRRLDWSYFDNSGMTAYLIRLSTELFGVSTPFTVRFPFLVLSFASTYLVYRISVLCFFERRWALVAAAAFNMTPVSILGASAAVHDNALIFFWLCTMWAAVKFHRSFQRDWFFVIGLTTGLAIQSKYTGILLLPCLLVFLLTSREHRGCLMRHEPWLGVAVAFVFVLPILLWNVEHHWASLGHILFIGAGARSWSQRILDGLGYHAAQFLIVSPLFYAGMIAATFSAAATCIRTHNPEKLLLLWFGLPLLLFGALAFRGHVEANWGFMGYASILILSVAVIGEALTEGRSRLSRHFGRKYQVWALIFTIAPTALVATHAWIGLLPASYGRRFAKDDRIIWETHGWRDLGRRVGELRSADDIIAADTYQLCALLEFNTPGQPYVRYLAPWDRPTQFDVWEPSFENLRGRTLLFVSSKPLVPSSPERTTIYEHFSRVEPLPVFEVIYHGVGIRRMYLYRCHDFNPTAPRVLGPRQLKYVTH
uniref:Glycosyltransferase family 39 protein n=1 Tax=Desulfomonile tiedjei TaxID=2358 RepID=A0A7C4ATD2_9BACT